MSNHKSVLAIDLGVLLNKDVDVAIRALNSKCLVDQRLWWRLSTI
jgi:hypothetical protein